MKQWMAKLGQGMARLAVWRKRAAQAEDAAVEPVFTAEADAAPATVSPAAPAADSSLAAVAPVAPAPSPTAIDDPMFDGLAELDDSSFTPADSVDTLLGDGLAELNDPSAPMQNETISADTLYTDNSADGLTELDALSAVDADPAESEPAAPDLARPEPAPDVAAEMAAEAVLASLTLAVDAAPVAAAARPGLQDAEAASKSDADAPQVSRLQRLISAVRRFAGRSAVDATAQPVLEDAEATPESELAADAPQGSRLQRLIGRIRQSKSRRPNLKGLGLRLIGIVGKKRVWIPGVSLALLGVVGSLAFMLVQSSSEKAKLEADLSAAKQALKQAAVKPGVAAIPPLLAAPVPPVDAQPAPAETPAAQPAAATLYVAQASTKGDPVQMGCDVSDKASVSLTLKNCIAAFNQATGH